MKDFFTDLPKVELHAHLNGSLNEETVRELMTVNSSMVTPQAEIVIEKGSRRTLKECFEMFKVIQKLTGRREDIKFITKKVVSDFAFDGVHYLELRSTPRHNEVTGLSKRSYIEAVLEGIQEFQVEFPDCIVVRFLLSIDRRSGVEEAEDTVNLAIEYQVSSNGLVVGIDFSGDPYIGDAREYIDVLKKARDAGLKLSLHMAEIARLHEENTALLSLPPDRIGHGTFLHENQISSQIVLKQRIPLEICLTSNVKVGTVESYGIEHHHMHKWKKLCHPYIICTDDKGVFSTTLSNEYRIAAAESIMSHSEVYELSKNAIDHIFASDDLKSHLKNKWNQWKIENQHYFV